MKSFFRGKRVFITGHTGFKGAWLSEWLLELGAELGGFSLDVPTEPSLFEQLELAGRMDDLRGDIRELGSLTKALQQFEPELVFHMAAQSLVRESYDDPVGTFSTNAQGTVHLLEALRSAPSVRAAVIITTDKVYENAGAAGHPFEEEEPLGGSDPYSASKACAELVLRSYVRSFFPGERLRLASARAGNVIGGGDWSADRLVPDCARAWGRGLPVSLRNPSSTRPWQHVLEPLSGYLWLARALHEGRQGVHGEAFNFGPLPESTRTTRELVEELQRHWKDCQLVVDGAVSHKKEAAHLSLSPAKAERVLRWRPRLSFQQTCDWTVRWYRAPADQRRSVTGEQLRAYTDLLGRAV